LRGISASGLGGNWQINASRRYRAGSLSNVSISTDTANTSAGGTYRPNLVGAPSANCGDGHLTGCIAGAAFAMPAQYTYGAAGRNLLHGPHLFDSDISVFKNFPDGEKLRFQFRAEVFNLSNSPEFGNPSAVFGTASFGNITGTSVDNRYFQFGAKLDTPASGWLDEWDRLKGGHLLSLGRRAKSAPLLMVQNCPFCPSAFLVRGCTVGLAPVQSRPWRQRNRGPEMFAREIPLLTAQPGNGDCTLPL